MKDVITSRQGMSMIIIFMADAIVLGTAKEAKSDIWIAILLGLAIVIMLATLYSWILSAYPGKNLYDILTTVFGKWVGSVLGVLYLVYALYVGALVLVTMSCFVCTVGLVYTPNIIIAALITVLIIGSLKKGIEVMGRWSEFFTRIIIPISIVTIIFMFPMVEANNLQPVLANGWQPILEGAYGVVAFPFAEIVVFMLIFSTKSVRHLKNIYYIFIGGLLLGGLFVFLAHVVAFNELGQFSYTRSYFPIYAAISRISIHDVLQRIEIIVAVGFIIGGFMKVALYVLAGCEGIRKVMNLKDYRFVVTPISILVLIVGITTFDDMMDVVNHVPYYNVLAIFMQVILPIIITLAILIHQKLQKHHSKNKMIG
ncbi:endospore germination permease [Vallitalea pronyensis]|uniref:Endospore germination permease n=1 Tax=Vallitalea pronyensis TaxID=1348613 RepID=A0A8J8MMZ2_9FIRM|nr:endospore germination permease [Vallitalea pronyensis]QUI24412.1 endospore germination permease [Vallitalea pronyensis]